MVDFEWKTKMVSADMPIKSPRLSERPHLSIPIHSFRAIADMSPAPESACSAYEQYLRLPELKKLCGSRDFPEWTDEPLIKPALQALEVTFRLVSIVCSDPRPYVNKREWKSRLESLATTQIQLIAALCTEGEGEQVNEGEASRRAPILDLNSSNGVLPRKESSAEVWKLAGDITVVSRTSETSLLPRLAAWEKSQGVAQKVLYSIECEMMRCPFTLGLGEPNLAGKPSLDFDSICKPSQLQSLRRNHSAHIDNCENQILYTTHQIIETWIFASHQLLKRIAERIDDKRFDAASSDCYLLERIWKLLADIEDVHLLMDPADFLRLKAQLLIGHGGEDDEAFCFRSKGLVEMARLSKELRHKVPSILGVEVDPMGGPAIQQAAMKLYTKREDCRKVHLLQALQSVESAMKRFFYAYNQVLVVAMGSLDAKWNKFMVSSESCDSLAQVFLEPTYFPSLDAAKTFLGDSWRHQRAGSGLDQRGRLDQSLG